ncbi:MAG: phosphopentomutase [Candidatus Eremiobacteraeota bacterium]|nr:phosphopentomutase [Candidatus Eremiobacteraeota bacterium]MBV8498155.1 phosphopentomutase [Candidatus Eremiobacteraeota bacterium]
MTRMVTIVIDSGGIGALADAAEFGDAPGADTIGNVARRVGGLRLPNFQSLGLGALARIDGVPAVPRPDARVARLRELSRGKDTITGHWEMMGILTEVPFPTYPDGFPADVIDAFTAIVGKPPLGNRAASGTEIIEELGAAHVETGSPILYTSADSVFQIAAHEEVVPLERLYEWSRRAREMLRPPHAVNRVIARPFVGEPGAFRRTPNRRDYAIEPPANLLDELRSGHVEVHAVGKIGDIYCGRAITTWVRVRDDRDAIEKTFALLESVDNGFIFTNLNDFDSKYGHRRDVRGYARALERLDAMLPGLRERLRTGDELIFTADHGCDPTAPGSDHTREYVPFLHVGPQPGGALGDIEGLDYVGRTVKRALLK